MRIGVALCLVVGCGSSSKNAAEPRDPEQEAADQRRREIEAMKPASPYELREQHVYRPTERCGQGPYRLESDSLRATYGERLIVYACGKHAIKGNYALTTNHDNGRSERDESAFGFRRNNEACKGREVVGVGSGPSSGGGSSSGARSQTGGVTSAVPTTLKAVALESTTSVPTDCVKSSIIDYGWLMPEEGVAVDARFVIDIWSDEPNDLEGLSFIVEKHAVVADMTPERWRAYRAASDAHHKAYMANLDIEVRAGRTTLLDSKVKTPPPPPPRAEVQPPRPSKNARWIPGYWFYGEAKFHWITGLWDVPEEDIVRELTVEAPKPPPVEPIVEAKPPEPQPVKTAVWTPGSWQWDGRVYVWVEGAWRIPPDANHTWQRPTWNVRAGRARFVPGGWKIRVRLGR